MRTRLQAGRPIVATPFPALLPYAAHVAVATTAADFVADLTAACASSGKDAAARQAAVAGESWAARAADVAALIDGLAA